MRKIKGQTTLEYAILIAVIVGGLLAMHIYMKRGVEGRLKSSSDNIGEQFDADKTKYNYTITKTFQSEEITKGGEIASASSETQTKHADAEETVAKW